MQLDLLPETFTSKIDPRDQEGLGLKRNRKRATDPEKEMHNHFSNWLLLRAIPKVHCGTHKKSTIEPGHPDFTLLYGGANLCIEFKAAGAKLQPEQEKRIEYLRRAGNKVVICYSFTEAIAAVKQHFDL